MSAVDPSPPIPLAVPRLVWLPWIGLAALAVFVFVVYWPTWDSMRRVWDTPTYTHGYVIPLIAAWLIWRDRHRLKTTPVRRGWLASIALLACGFLWLLGMLAGVNAASHFAVVGMLVALVPLLFGWALARQLAFPLAFLFFAVPFGDFLLPVMMSWTADITVAMVRLSGVPIYREGLDFILPSGRWMVVEECSGQRYLVAALPLACMFAHLNFDRLRQQIAFVVLAVAIALIGNWVRAYGIVMLGHLSGMQIATGVDHLVYGWLFFGILMAMIFGIGARWASTGRRDDGASLQSAGLDSGRIEPASGRSLVVALSIGFAALAVWPSIESDLQDRSSPALDLGALGLDAFSLRDPAGEPDDAAPDAYAPDFRGAAQAVSLAFDDDAGRAWIGKYEHQQTGGEMIGSSALSGITGRRDWRVVASRPRRVTAPDAAFDVHELELERHGKRVRVWHFYAVAGVRTPSDATAKLLTAWQVLRGSGDQAFVALLWRSIDVNDPAGAADPVLKQGAIALHHALVQAQR